MCLESSQVCPFLYTAPLQSCSPPHLRATAIIHTETAAVDNLIPFPLSASLSRSMCLRRRSSKRYSYSGRAGRWRVGRGGEEEHGGEILDCGRDGQDGE